MTGAEVVDLLFARGFTEIIQDKRGAVPVYYLQHPKTKSGFRMKRNNGMLNYAQALIERRDDAQASPATQSATASRRIKKKPRPCTFAGTGFFIYVGPQAFAKGAARHDPGVHEDGLVELTAQRDFQPALFELIRHA